jgi:hypothetical protein
MMTPETQVSGLLKPLPRSRFDHWCWLRGVKLSEIGQAVGCRQERARRMRLPFGDPLRVVPSEQEMARIVSWTRGEITPADFYPPELTPSAEAAA